MLKLFNLEKLLKLTLHHFQITSQQKTWNPLNFLILQPSIICPWSTTTSYSRNLSKHLTTSLSPVVTIKKNLSNFATSSLKRSTHAEQCHKKPLIPIYYGFHSQFNLVDEFFSFFKSAINVQFSQRTHTNGFKLYKEWGKMYSVIKSVRILCEAERKEKNKGTCERLKKRKRKREKGKID